MFYFLQFSVRNMCLLYNFGSILFHFCQVLMSSHMVCKFNAFIYFQFYSLLPPNWGILVLVVGPNGIGKSTILKLISGELQPTSGTVFRSAKVLFIFSLSAVVFYCNVLLNLIGMVLPSINGTYFSSFRR